MSKRNRFILCLVAALALVVTGCQHNIKAVSNTPTGVSSDEVKDWYGAVGALDQVSQVNHQTFELLQSLKETGVWTDEASYLSALKALGRVDVIELSTANILQNQPNNWSQPVQSQVKLAVVEMLARLTDVATQGALGIKDKASQSKLSGSLTLLQQTVNLVGTFIEQGISIQGATPIPNTGTPDTPTGLTAKPQR